MPRRLLIPAAALAALALPGAGASAGGSCAAPQGARTLAATSFVRAYEVTHPEGSSARATLYGCLRATGQHRELVTEFESPAERRSYEFIGVGARFVGFSLQESDVEGGLLIARQVIDLRNGRPAHGYSVERVIDLRGHRIAWTADRRLSGNRERRGVWAAGPRGERRLSRHRRIDVDHLRARGRRVYWREGRRTRSAVMP